MLHPVNEMNIKLSVTVEEIIVLQLSLVNMQRQFSV